VLLFAELIRTRDAMDARIAAVEQRGQQPAGPDTTAADNEAEMDQLGDAIEAIGDRLTALEGVSAQRTADLAASGSETRRAAATGSAPPPTPQIAQVQGEAPDARLAAMLDERLASLEARIDELRAARPSPSDTEAAATEAAGSSNPEAETVAPATRTLTTDKDMVVLQLAGLPNRADVEYFIARHQLPKQIYVKVDSLRGRTWYGVIAGLYPDMAAAEVARDALPPELAKLDIWLRILPAGTQLEVLKGKG
jgi:septal ring-binding cell division protein DamX